MNGHQKTRSNAPKQILARARGMACCIVGLLLAVSAEKALAQAHDEHLRFEVASIKPHGDAGGTQAGIEINESLVRITNLSLRAVIGIADGVRDSLLVGPARLDRGHFDIVAKPPAGWDYAQLPMLMRNLLADRFKLVAHHEMKEVPGYALRIPAGGSRLRQSDGPRTYLTGRPGLIAGNGRSVSELVSLLSQMVSTPVVDETELKGAYDLKLEWTPQLSASNVGTSAEPEVSIFTALREQLGLRLEPIRVTTDVVVVDSVNELPTEN